MRLSSTSAIRLSSAGNMLTSAAVSLTSTCLAAAAERTPAMWTDSARLAAERRKRRDESPGASRCGRSQVRVVMRRRRQWRERARECSSPPEDSGDDDVKADERSAVDHIGAAIDRHY